MTTWSYNISKDMTTWSPSSERRFAMQIELTRVSGLKYRV